MARKRYKPEEIVNLLRCQRRREYVSARTSEPAQSARWERPGGLSVERAVHSALSVLPKPDRL